MIVLDASAAIEWLLRTHSGIAIAERIFSSSETLHAPHLLDIEIAQALRRCSRSGMLEVPGAKKRFEISGISESHVTRTRRYCRGYGNCATTSPLMTRCTSRWRNRSTPRYLPATAGWRPGPDAAAAPK
jgi:hypothetical protein